jgi:bifunctional polynucleotide phosphatase/kinase
MYWKEEDTVVMSSSLKFRKKIASFDLDHTLISPSSGRIQPKDEEDWKLVFPNVIEVLEELNEKDYSVVIFSNQSSLYKEDRRKIILNRIKKLLEMVSFEIHVFISSTYDYCRKPNTGIWEKYFDKKGISKSKSFFVGDAAGRLNNIRTGKKDFSCSDRMFASNVGLPFYTPEEFFQPNVYDKKEPYEEPETWKTFPKSQKSLKLEGYNVIILMGAPGSGKTTFSKSHSEYTHINKDILGTDAKCLKLMKKELEAGKKVIIDMTSPKKSKRKAYIQVAKQFSQRCLCVWINVTKTQSFFLVNYRCKIDLLPKIPDVAVHSYFKYFEKPTKSEGFDSIEERSFVPDPKIVNMKLFQQYY